MIRLGQRGNDRDRTILFKLPSVRLKRLILSSARKLRNYGAAVFISKELTNEEAATENESLKKKREILDQGQNKKDFSVRDGKLFKKDGNQLIVISPKTETTDNNCLRQKANLLLYNVRSILEYSRRTLFSNAIQSKNI